MKPSLKSVKEKMGVGGAISKDRVAKEIQKLIANNDCDTPELRGLIAGMLWVFSRKFSFEINDDINDLIDAAKPE